LITTKHIKELVRRDLSGITGIRHYLHAHPELSEQEEQTAAYISGLLDEWGLEHQTGVGGYGITGLIKGKNPGKKVIALRADMDALPITEENEVPYKSLTPGVMHACGHDVHMSCLLGAVKILHELHDEFEGTIKYIFQPAEELAPGGALRMIEDGVLENPAPQLICGQHVFPELEAGQLGFKSGIYMASSDEITLTVRGKGGHAALPDTYDNTVLAAAKILVELEQTMEAHRPPDIPSVLAFGKLAGDGTYNIMPAKVVIQGILRTFDENWREQALRLMEETAKKTAASSGTECEVFIRKSYPVLVNDTEVTETARKAAIEFVGEENVKELQPRTTVEDFARYTQLIPGCFYRLGIANREKGIASNLHSATFDVDESSLETGTGFMIWNALAQLKT
jgi:amidohydrolase